MPHYRTEIVIPPDRYVCLQLPAHLPEGRATVTVHIPGPDDPEANPPSSEPDADHQDIEWWEEFEGDPEGVV